MRETQQRALMDSIPKDLNRPWEDPLPEPGERHIAQELRGLGYTQEAVPEWKTKSMGKGYAECGSNHRLADQPTLLLTRLSPIVEQRLLRLPVEAPLHRRTAAEPAHLCAQERAHQRCHREPGAPPSANTWARSLPRPWLAASRAHGCSLPRPWLQPPVPMAAASRAHGCSLPCP